MVNRQLPHPSELSAPFWTAARNHVLVVQACADCGMHIFYPRVSCTACGSLALRWARVSGRGTIYTFTVVRRPVHPALAARVPYVIAVIELAEGPRLTNTVVDADPDRLHIGQSVVVGFEDHPEISLPVFRLLS